MKLLKKFKSSLAISLILGFLSLLFGACQTTPPTPTTPPPTKTAIAVAATATPAPTFTPTPQPLTCADLDATWGQDWPAALTTLEKLIAAGQSCGDEPLLSKKYAAHYIYGAALEEKGERDTAITQYRAALAIDPQRQEALDALVRLKALPKPTPPACLSTAAPGIDPAPAATPDTTQFVTVKGDQLQLAGKPFIVKESIITPVRRPGNVFWLKPIRRRWPKN
ncbi:MAG: tetratricopeptide repeat protein [Anaerolineae bacterium]